MIKSFFLLLTIFFLHGYQEAVYSQVPADSVEIVETDPDSLYKPVADNGMLLQSAREVPQKQVKSYLLNPDYAYANDPDYWKEEAPVKPGVFSRMLTSRVTEWIILIAVLGIALYGFYHLARENNFNWFSGNRKQASQDMADLSHDEEIDFDEAIRKYHAEGNYRLAVRYMYLRLIRQARQKNGIVFRDSSTNAEIVRAFGNGPKADEFRFLATAYEYVFYGGFLPKQELYLRLKNRFEAFQQNISA